jgi:hypothetical protein
MPHIFRKYGGYNINDVKCWSLTSAINTDNFEVLDSISIRGGSKIGTSIPSPMARMELFDTAFHIVATDTKNNLKGNSVYHQLVSDCLDVMQLLFNTNETDIGPDKKIWFKEWKVQENLEKLKSRGPAHPHNLLAKAFTLVFDQNVAQAGFEDTESIFLIYYENKLLGGTSPLTMFFTSPNWERYISDGQIADVPKSMDNDTFFDNDYRALFEREKSFIEFLYKLLLKNPARFEKCAGLKKYINKTIDTYFQDFNHTFSDWNLQGAKNLNTEYSLFKTNIDGKFLTINGIYFYHQQESSKRNKIKTVSDFLIRATNNKYAVQKDKDGNLLKIDPPLVLVNGMNIPGDYMEQNSPWNSNTKIKYFLQKYTPLFERKLPQGDSLTVIYPFITTEDFLEDFLIEMPFKLNGAKFHTGYNGDFKYLLPIKKEYFNYFDLADLKNNLSIVLSEKEVIVNLKVPIRNKRNVSDITFTKSYLTDRAARQILDCRADIGIFPFYKINDPDLNYLSLNDYTILLAERNEKIKFEAMNFYSFNNTVYGDNRHDDKIPAKQLERSSQSDVEAYNSLTTSKFYRVKEAFDYIELRYNGPQSDFSGLIIPNFENKLFNKQNLNKSFTFAIDFGTSNTHIAYKDGSSSLPKPFEIDEDDQQMVLLNAPGEHKDLGLKYTSYGQFPRIDLTLNREFMPAIVKSNGHSTVSFPFKTATCEISAFNNMDKSKAELFSHINVGYHIEKEGKNQEGKISSSINYTTNLKWLLENNIDVANRSRVLFFLKQLLIQIKAKAILNYCKPDQLDILWSIPSSMDSLTKSEIKKIMKEAFQDVFPNAERSKLMLLDEPIKESVAPYFFLTKSDSGIQEGANVINVDIGGGTTDVMMFMESTNNRKDKYLTTSFRFAGSDLWGSGYKGKLKDNGFIKNYLTYKKANNIETEETKYFIKAQEDNNLSSDDLISLLFKYDNKFKYSNSITDGNANLSLILYLHYSAIIYHICEIIEQKDYPLPRYLSFTGKGSQYLRLLCNNDESELISFTKLLFKAYSSRKLQTSFRIHINEDPKVITANGTIEYFRADREDQFIEVPKNASFEDYDHDVRKKYQEFIHPGFSTDKTVAVPEDFAKENHDFLIGDTLDIDSELNLSVLTNVNLFLSKTLNNQEIIDFLNGFKVRNTKSALDELKWDGDIFNGQGLVYDSYKKVLKDLHKQDKQYQIAESLFFYALKDALYRLSKSITDSKS